MSTISPNASLGEEKISRLIFRYSVPAIIGQIVNMLYSVVDRIYIGNIPHVGGFAITGLGITMPITMIVTGFGMLVGIGAAANISLSFGRGDQSRAKKYLANGILGIGVISVRCGLCHCHLANRCFLLAAVLLFWQQKSQYAPAFFRFES